MEEVLNDDSYDDELFNEFHDLLEAIRLVRDLLGDELSTVEIQERILTEKYYLLRIKVPEDQIAPLLLSMAADDAADLYAKLCVLAEKLNYPGEF